MLIVPTICTTPLTMCLVATASKADVRSFHARRQASVGGGAKGSCKLRCRAQAWPVGVLFSQAKAL